MNIWPAPFQGDLDADDDNDDTGSLVDHSYALGQ